ncbi:hypothetical protein M758_6G072900 [Ceratodon purpureus]|nr:hypothetical protein M758_6G072900 [Ceratodon purpureus]
MLKTALYAQNLLLSQIRGALNIVYRTITSDLKRRPTCPLESPSPKLASCSKPPSRPLSLPYAPHSLSTLLETKTTSSIHFHPEADTIVITICGLPTMKHVYVKMHPTWNCVILKRH